MLQPFGTDSATLWPREVVPTLKVFSQMELPNGVLNVATLNLKDRKVTFEEEVTAKKNASANGESTADPKGLDWTRLKSTLKESDPSTVNVRVLQDRHPTPIFLRDELLRRITANSARSTPDKSSPVHVYVLLSGGLDSSSVACLAAQVSAQPMAAFSTIDRQPPEEAAGIEQVLLVNRGLQLYRDDPGDDCIETDMAQCLWHQEEPFADGSMLAHFRLMRLARPITWKRRADRCHRTA